MLLFYLFCLFSLSVFIVVPSHHKIMERRAKTNPLQWSVFLDFAEKHPEIVTKKFTTVGGKQKYNELWKEISTILNSMGFQHKTVEKWQKVREG